jgi:hypothetical protein
MTVSIVCLLALLAPGPAAQPSFERVDVSVGTETSGILAMFLNEDDHLDLVVLGDDRLIRLLGRGDGRFDAVGSVSAGENAVDLASADLNEDGFDDIVVVNHATDYVTLLFGAPGGGFDTRASRRLEVNVSPHPHAVQLNDLDGDGHEDLLVDDRAAEAIRVFRGSGNGEFELSTPIQVGGDPYRGMRLDDVDADGLIDVLTPNPDRVAILFGDGFGRFSGKPSLRPGFAPFAVTTADIDGDGHTDVAASSGEQVGALAIWFGTGEGTFRAGKSHELAVGPTRLAAADLTGDGRSEVVVTSYVGGGVAVLVGGADPMLDRMDLEGYPYGVTTGDFDADGRIDFAVANDAVNHITVFLSRK